MRKVPVGVLVQFGSSGDAIPISVTWEDGRVYPIESIIELRPARTSGSRFRYTVRIHNQDTYLYRDGDRWHMESAQ